MYLSDLRNVWPWKQGAAFEDIASKTEIYYQILGPQKVWEVPLMPPARGMTYVGVKVTLVDAEPQETGLLRLTKARGVLFQEAVFGSPWDQALLTNKKWKELGFPIPYPVTVSTPMTVLLKWDRPLAGKVEFLAVQLEDVGLQDIGYAFLNDRAGKIQWIAPPHLPLFPPPRYYPDPLKLLPSLYRVLDPKEPEWFDKNIWTEELDVQRPIPEVPPYPLRDFKKKWAIANKEEIVAAAWHPRRVGKWIEMGIDVEAL